MKRKVARVSAPPRGGKYAPTPQPPRGFKDQRPAWLLARVDLDGQWNWGAMDRPDVERVHAKLKGFETMTWHEVLATTKSHEVPADQVSASAQKRLTDLRLDGVVETLISLRVTGPERVWGYMREPERGALNLLWWDPTHSVYPVEKKHT